MAVDVVGDGDGQHLVFEGATKAELPDTPPVEPAGVIPPAEPAAAAEEG